MKYYNSYYFIFLFDIKRAVCSDYRPLLFCSNVKVWLICKNNLQILCIVKKSFYL